ncbi:MAG: stage 0 sporulation family protein [Clostridia bacterium]|nr:stage 0 sporulation family protein [Clostridia bacterium]
MEIIGVRFGDLGKIYYFSPEGIRFRQGDRAIVETVNGTECALVVMPNREAEEKDVVQPLKPVIRKADEKDYARLDKMKADSERAFTVCEKKIAEHGLKMKLIKVDYAFDNSKITFYYTSPNRVDFRELVKDLAYTFRSRIELRQIGVRDNARLIGGLGPCGREFCCRGFMRNFRPVSIKMAKEQGFSLYPAKISGSCGRLMCCLSYEQESYEYLLSITPKVGALVETPEGRFNVTDINLLTGMLTLKSVKDPAAAPKVIHRDGVKIIRDGKITVRKEEIDALKDIE